MIPLRLLLLLLLMPFVSIAQHQVSASVNPVDAPPRWMLKFAPLSLIDPDNTIQFGVERRLDNRNAVQVEAGYGFQGMNLWQNVQNTQYTDRQIWRGRAEWRHYLRQNGWPNGAYVALEGLYKQINVRESSTTGVVCVSGPCQYYQQVTTPLEKYVWGAHVKLGGQASLTPDWRLLVDIYMGIGIRNRQIKRFDTGNANYYFNYSNLILNTFSPYTSSALSLSGGIKFGYAL